MVELIVETKIKNGRKIRLFRAKDGRYYKQNVSFNPGEDTDFEWISKWDWQNVWRDALVCFWGGFT